MLFPYKPLTTPLPAAQWKADLAAAHTIKGVHFGEQCVYLDRFGGLGGWYIPYTDVVRWFVNMEAAVGGEATFHIYRFAVNYGEEGECVAALGDYSANLNEKTPLDEIRTAVSAHPEIPFGRDYDRKSRFRINR